MSPAQHYQHSSYRERLIEQLFLGELLKLSWITQDCSLEVAQPEVDNSGYDVICEAGSVIRHIQLKTSVAASTTDEQKVHVKLAQKPSGCVVWIYFDPETLQLGPFLYFGAGAGEKMPPLPDSVAKHTKANAEGVKGERVNHRVVRSSRFRRIETIAELYALLFTPATGTSPESANA
jgi:hypothetical protein